MPNPSHMCTAAAQSNSGACTMHRMQILTLRGLWERRTYFGCSEQLCVRERILQRENMSQPFSLSICVALTEAKRNEKTEH